MDECKCNHTSYRDTKNSKGESFCMLCLNDEQTKESDASKCLGNIFVNTRINYYDLMKLLSDIEDYEHPTNQVSIIEEDF